MTALFAGATYILLKRLNSPMTYRHNDTNSDVGATSFLICCFCTAFFGFWAGVFTDHSIMQRSYRAEMIERGFAEYDSKTGEWRMKDDTVKK